MYVLGLNRLCFMAGEVVREVGRRREKALMILLWGGPKFEVTPLPSP